MEVGVPGRLREEAEEGGRLVHRCGDLSADGDSKRAISRKMPSWPAEPASGGAAQAFYMR